MEAFYTVQVCYNSVVYQKRYTTSFRTFWSAQVTSREKLLHVCIIPPDDKLNPNSLIMVFLNGRFCFTFAWYSYLYIKSCLYYTCTLESPIFDGVTFDLLSLLIKQTSFENKWHQNICLYILKCYFCICSIEIKSTWFLTHICKPLSHKPDVTCPNFNDLRKEAPEE